MVLEASEVRRKAETHLEKMIAKRKDAQTTAKDRSKAGKDVWFEDGAWRQRWYGPPEYLWPLMPEREDPKNLYTSFRHLVLAQTEEVCHESAVRHLRRYA